MAAKQMWCGHEAVQWLAAQTHLRLHAADLHV